MRITALVLLLVLLFTAVACMGNPLPTFPGYTRKYILDEDIPFPKSGYEYLASESFTYIAPASDSLRVAELYLRGDTRVDEMVEFYKYEMPLHDYELVAAVDSGAVHKTSLTFRRKGENEEVKIDVWREDTFVHIKIQVYPT